MQEKGNMNAEPLPGERLLTKLAALANPHRCRILAVLTQGPRYVSQLAREVKLSRPLLQMHLRKLEAAELVWNRMEISNDGKAMKFYEVRDFDLRIAPSVIAAAAKTLGNAEDDRE
jgi:predicted transcriptional regulator